jgi:putative ABC transport system permease protein
VLGFTAVLSLATGLLFGVFPSLRISRVDLAGALRESGITATGSSSVRHRILGMNVGGLLVVAQVALSTVLLIGATLMIRTLGQLRSVDTGFQSAGLLTARIALPTTSYNTPEKRARFFAELGSRVQTIPGVRGTATVSFLPTTGMLGTNIFIRELPTTEANGYLGTRLQTVTPNYFRVFGIPLRRGREFTAADNVPGAPPVVIINESFARRFWPAYPNGPDPIGQHIGAPAVTKSSEFQIIGIVADVLHFNLAVEARPQFFYVPNVFYPPQRTYLAVRSNSDPRGLINAIRASVYAIDPAQPLADIRMMEDILEASVSQQRLTTLLLGVFSGIALLLSIVGIYGVLAYWVTQRNRELAIRRALGAQAGELMRTVFGHSLVLVLAGEVAGIVGAMALTRVMTGLLFRVKATDPATFLGVAMLFLGVGLASVYIPARRAARVDPLVALRDS